MPEREPDSVSVSALQTMMQPRFGTLDELRLYLRERCAEESRDQFGITSKEVVDGVVDNWFDDERNYDGRWSQLERFGLEGGRVLDMAAGCGTFLLYGLRQGRDVVGVEPENWKRHYFREKVRLAGLPDAWSERLIDATGEQLPFADGSFDVVTSWQTLEHVQDLETCIRELLRVLKPGGLLLLRAPDYRGFYEPHYRLPFLPCMNRTLARRYLRLLRRPTEGLDTLVWTTRPRVMRALRAAGHPLRIRSHHDLLIDGRFDRQFGRSWIGRMRAARALFTAAARMYVWLRDSVHVGRRERSIHLWVERLDDQDASAPNS